MVVFGCIEVVVLDDDEGENASYKDIISIKRYVVNVMMIYDLIYDGIQIIEVVINDY